MKLYEEGYLIADVNDYTSDGIDVEKREKVKKDIKAYLKKVYWKPVVAYIYDGVELCFSYCEENECDEDEREQLSGKTFDFFGADGYMFGNFAIQESWEGVLKELGINVPVNPVEYFQDSDDEDDEY